MRTRTRTWKETRTYIGHDSVKLEPRITVLGRVDGDYLSSKYSGHHRRGRREGATVSRLVTVSTGVGRGHFDNMTRVPAEWLVASDRMKTWCRWASMPFAYATAVY